MLVQLVFEIAAQTVAGGFGVRGGVRVEADVVDENGIADV